jgi:hypothetical protein
VNVELALASLEDAKANPGNFDMDSFFSSTRAITKEADGFQAPPCGTTACYAGFVSLRVAPKGSRIIGGYVIEPDGTRKHAETYATKALDITEDQADTLFYVGTIGQVEAIVNHLADSPDADGDALYAVASEA